MSSLNWKIEVSFFYTTVHVFKFIKFKLVQTCQGCHTVQVDEGHQSTSVLPSCPHIVLCKHAFGALAAGIVVINICYGLFCPMLLRNVVMMTAFLYQLNQHYCYTKLALYII